MGCLGKVSLLHSLSYAIEFCFSRTLFVILVNDFQEMTNTRDIARREENGNRDQEVHLQVQNQVPPQGDEATPRVPMTLKLGMSL